MSVRHHLDQATLMRFAAGELDEAFNAVVASHLAYCEDCRAALRTAEGVGGALLEEVTPAPMAAHSLDALMARLDAEEGTQLSRSAAFAPAGPSEPMGADGVPVPLKPYLGGGYADLKWRRIAPGVDKCVLPVSPGATGLLFLLRINPGLAMPEHGHGGDEMTLILQGSYEDAMGEFGVGDIADLDEDVEHKPVVNSEVACICLVATEKPTRFKSLLSRTLQPFFGI